MAHIIKYKGIVDMPFNSKTQRNVSWAEGTRKKQHNRSVFTRKLRSQHKTPSKFKSTRRHKVKQINWKKVIGRLIVLLFQLKMDPASLAKRDPELRKEFSGVDFNVPRFGAKPPYKFPFPESSKGSVICPEPGSSPFQLSTPKLIGAPCAETKAPTFKAGSLVKAVAAVAEQMCPATKYDGTILQPKCIDPKVQLYAIDWANKADVGITKLKNKDPTEDLCKEGTLCKGTLGIPRILMPSLDNPSDFLSRIHKQFSIDHERETCKMSDLLPAQGEIRRNRVEGAAAGMNETGKVFVTNPNGSKQLAAPIIISQDNYIVDGHHRWAAAHEKGLHKNKIPVIRIMAPIRDILMASALEPTNPF